MVIKDGAKMSKSRGNVVTPEHMMETVGADAARMYSLFAAPPDRDMDWQDTGVDGLFRFLSRVYRFVYRNASATRATKVLMSHVCAPRDLSPKVRQVQRKLHQTIKRVTDDFQGRWHFNTSVAAIMELVNELYGAEEEISSGKFPAHILADTQRKLVLLLAPFAPYIAAELWEMLGEKDVVFRHPWPEYDAALAKEEEVDYAIQVNGKLRSHVSVPADSPKELVIERALADEKVRAAIAGKKEVVNKIFVPGKLVNIVVR